MAQGQRPQAGIAILRTPRIPPHWVDLAVTLFTTAVLVGAVVWYLMTFGSPFR